MSNARPPATREVTTTAREREIDALRKAFADLAWCVEAGFLTMKEAGEQVEEALFEFLRPGELSPRRKAALFRLYAVNRFLLGTTALTPMPWARG